MDSPQQEQLRISSLPSPVPSSASLDTSTARYLTIPTTAPSGPYFCLPGPDTSERDSIDTLLIPEDQSVSASIPGILGPPQDLDSASSFTLPVLPSQPCSLSARVYMSVYSSSSVDTELSEFSNPPARRYRVPNTPKMSKKISTVHSPTNRKYLTNPMLMLMMTRPKRNNTSVLYKPTRSTRW
jgi:hypothetical protein